MSVTPDSSVSVEENSITTFSVEAIDPEGMTLHYRWFLDGEEVGSDTAVHAYKVTWPDIGAHTLCCYVEDDLWTNVVFSQWNVTVTDFPFECSTEASLSGMQMGA